MRNRLSESNFLLFCPTRAKTRENGAFYGSRHTGNAGKSRVFRESDRQITIYHDHYTRDSETKATARSNISNLASGLLYGIFSILPKTNSTGFFTLHPVCLGLLNADINAVNICSNLGQNLCRTRKPRTATSGFFFMFQSSLEFEKSWRVNKVVS